MTPDVLAHAGAPEAVAATIVYSVSDAAAPVSRAVVPAYGAWAASLLSYAWKGRPCHLTQTRSHPAQP